MRDMGWGRFTLLYAASVAVIVVAAYWGDVARRLEVLGFPVQQVSALLVILFVGAWAFFFWKAGHQYYRDRRR